MGHRNAQPLAELAGAVGITARQYAGGAAGNVIEACRRERRRNAAGGLRGRQRRVFAADWCKRLTAMLSIPDWLPIAPVGILCRGGIAWRGGGAGEACHLLGAAEAAIAGGICRRRRASWFIPELEAAASWPRLRSGAYMTAAPATVDVAAEALLAHHARHAFASLRWNIALQRKSERNACHFPGSRPIRRRRGRMQQVTPIVILQRGEVCVKRVRRLVVVDEFRGRSGRKFGRRLNAEKSSERATRVRNAWPLIGVQILPIARGAWR